ncbi:MAG: L,D-transpeptidase family protein [Rhodobacteraceae bacterium]|nr:L,D-transpeptidase family protein [Paracoccaceae bacterium]
MIRFNKIFIGGLITLIGLLLVGCDNYIQNNINTENVSVTKLEVKKSTRELKIYSGDRVWRSMKIELGRNPLGHKTQEGDGKTPEGLYYIDRKNPRSLFHLSLGISYPNTDDIAQAQSRGVSAGGDIMIHGQPNQGRRSKKRDWTEGCIAVTNREMELLYRIVPVGTPIIIKS